jgi:hypothetical protein
MSNTKLKNLKSAGVIEQRRAALIACGIRFHEEFATGVQLMRKGLIDVKPLTTQYGATRKRALGLRDPSDRNQAMKAQSAFS